MSSRAGRAARAEARARAAQQASQRAPDPGPEPDYNTPSSFYGASDDLNASISGWLNSNKGNKAVGAAGADLFYNSATAALKQNSDVNYAKAMMPHALDYQRQAQDIATRARRDEIEAQGAQDYRQEELRTGAQRYAADQSLTGQREGYQSQEKQIGLEGEEKRKTELTLRADARGAIRDRGRTLFA
jgi:hypothetical protein